LSNSCWFRYLLSLSEKPKWPILIILALFKINYLHATKDYMW
jgi:hypothetical protein